MQLIFERRTRLAHLARKTLCFLGFSFLSAVWISDVSAADAYAVSSNSDRTPIHLEIAPRRQWDCNYGMNGVNSCRCIPGDPNNDKFQCWDSCYGSSTPDGTDSLGVAACRCGEYQSSLASLCQPRVNRCVDSAQKGLRGNDSNPAAVHPKLPNCSGFCGSASIQQAALFHGAYISQGLIRLLGAGNDQSHDGHSYTGLELLIDYGDTRDEASVARALGFEVMESYPDADSSCSEAHGSAAAKATNKGFLDWVESHLRQQAPVITGVLVGQGGNDSDYDHIVPIVGMEWDNTGEKNPHNATLIINDNYNSRPTTIAGKGLMGDTTYCKSGDPNKHGIACQGEDSVCHSKGKKDGDCRDRCGNDPDTNRYQKCIDRKYSCAAGDRFCLGLQQCPHGSDHAGKTTAWGVAIHPPENHHLGYAVQINVKGCKDGRPCNLNGQPIATESQGGGSPGWMEPNVTVNSIDEEIFELTATLVPRHDAPHSALSLQNHKIARFRTDSDGNHPTWPVKNLLDSVKAIQKGKGPFHAPPDACFAVGQENLPFDVGTVKSHESAFFRLVANDEVECPDDSGDGTVVEPSVACPDFPRDESLCKKPGNSSLTLKARTNRSRASVSLAMTELGVHSDNHSDSHVQHTAIGDFGEPIGTKNRTAYRFCLYNGTGAASAEMATLMAEAEIPTGAGAKRPNASSSSSYGRGSHWRRLQNDNGFRYSNPSKKPDGVRSVSMKLRGKNGDPEIRLRALGSSSTKKSSDCKACPELPLDDEGTTTVQIINSRGACWSASFSDASKNTERLYQATSGD